MIYVLLADGFEEIEALTIVDYLRRADISVKTVSTTGKKIIHGAHNINVEADIQFSEIADDIEGVFIPGGMPGSTNLRDNSEVIDLVKKQYDKEKLISAICAGPIVLNKAGIISDKTVTSYPGIKGQLNAKEYSEDEVVVDGNIITARGPYLAGKLAFQMIAYLKGEEKAQEIKEGTLFNLHK